MMDPNRLWAKSRRDGEPEIPSLFLGGHLEDVYTAAIRVVSATADDQLKALDLEPQTYRDRLQRCVLLAAAVHDLGKANDHFQGMIRGTRDVRINPQGVRHEWITLRMLKELRQWLLPAVAGNEIDFAIVEWAVAGHHHRPGRADRTAAGAACAAGRGAEQRRDRGPAHRVGQDRRSSRVGGSGQARRTE